MLTRQCFTHAKTLFSRDRLQKLDILHNTWLHTQLLGLHLKSVASSRQRMALYNSLLIKMTTYTAAMYTASFALKMAALHIAIVYARQKKKMGKDTFFKARQCAALSLLWVGKTTTSVEKGQFFMSQCRYLENEQKCSLGSPLPTI